MSRPRKRFCPQGHDKDAEGGSYWTHIKNENGRLVRKRTCAQCTRNRVRNRLDTGKLSKREESLKLGREVLRKWINSILVNEFSKLHKEENKYE